MNHYIFIEFIYSLHTFILYKPQRQANFLTNYNLVTLLILDLVSDILPNLELIGQDTWFCLMI